MCESYAMFIYIELELNKYHKHISTLYLCKLSWNLTNRIKQYKHKLVSTFDIYFS